MGEKNIWKWEKRTEVLDDRWKKQKGKTFFQGQFVWWGYKSVNIFLNILWFWEIEELLQYVIKDDLTFGAMSDVPDTVPRAL